MTFVATKRFHGAGVLTGNWTWGRLISDADVVDPNQTDQGIIGYIQDFNNKRAERSLSTFAVRHRVNIVYSLGLPCGASNYSAARLAEAMEISRRNSLRMPIK